MSANKMVIGGKPVAGSIITIPNLVISPGDTVLEDSFTDTDATAIEDHYPSPVNLTAAAWQVIGGGASTIESNKANIPQVTGFRYVIADIGVAAQILTCKATAKIHTIFTLTSCGVFVRAGSAGITDSFWCGLTKDGATSWEFAIYENTTKVGTSFTPNDPLTEKTITVIVTADSITATREGDSGSAVYNSTDRNTNTGCGYGITAAAAFAAAGVQDWDDFKVVAG